MGSGIASQGWFFVVIFILIVMGAGSRVFHQYRQEDRRKAQEGAKAFCQHRVVIEGMQNFPQYIEFNVRSEEDDAWKGVITFDLKHPNYADLQRLQVGQSTQFRYRENVYRGAQPVFLGVYAPTDYIELVTSQS